MNRVQPNPLQVLAVSQDRAVLETYERVLCRRRAGQGEGSRKEDPGVNVFNGGRYASPACDLGLVSCCNQDAAVEAVRVALEREERFAVAFIDVRGEGGSHGARLAERIWAMDPAVEIVLIADDPGAISSEITHRLQPEERLLLLHRPLTPQQIRQFTSVLAAKWRSGMLLQQARADLEDRVKRQAAEPGAKPGELNADLAGCPPQEGLVRESEEKYRTLFERNPSPSFVHDAEGKFLDCNQAALQFLGCTKSELPGKSVKDFFPLGREDETLARYRTLWGQGGRVEAEYCVNGATRILDQIVTPAILSGKRVVFVVGKEITEYKQAEEGLRFFRNIINQSKDAMFLIDPETGSFLDVNATGLAGLGYAHEEIVDPDVVTMNDVLLGRISWQDYVNEIRKKGYVIAETELKARDGEIFAVEISAKIAGEKGKDYVVATARDITERKRARQERRMLQEQLQQSQKMEAIGTLAGGIAHDFNNLLFPIMGYADSIMHEAAEPGIIREWAGEILNASIRAKDLVKQILTFSRQGRQERVPLKIQAIIKESLKLLRATLPANIEIRQEIDEECGTILADPTQVHQIMMNLCTNAYHAMRKSGGVLEVGLKQVHGDSLGSIPGLDLRPVTYIRLKVRDTGLGMAAEVMDRIFEPYFTTKEQGEGTGMGLSMVHGIVKSYDGSITVDSEPGKGTTFRVYLPTVQVAAAGEEVVHMQPPPRGDEHILLVDDELQIVNMMRSMLERLGYRVTPRTSSVEALEAFRFQPERFDCVVTDQTMPNMTGAQLARELMRIRPDIPIILCTGFSEVISEDEARAMGIKQYVMKPIVQGEIADVIRKALHQD